MPVVKTNLVFLPDSGYLAANLLVSPRFRVTMANWESVGCLVALVLW